MSEGCLTGAKIRDYYRRSRNKLFLSVPSLAMSLLSASLPLKQKGSFSPLRPQMDTYCLNAVISPVVGGHHAGCGLVLSCLVGRTLTFAPFKGAGSLRLPRVGDGQRRWPRGSDPGRLLIPGMCRARPQPAQTGLARMGGGRVSALSLGSGGILTSETGDEKLCYGLKALRL